MQQYSTTIDNYKGIAKIVTGNTFNGNCTTSVDVSTDATENYRINTGAAVGGYLTIGTKEYIITQVDSSTVYVVLRYYEGGTPFNSNRSTIYAGSDIAAKCEEWYLSNVPSVWKNSANAFTTVSTEGVSAECFIPTYSQATRTWEYFIDASNRAFLNSNSNSFVWWTSTDYNSEYVWAICEERTINNIYPDYPYGFRPALAIKRSLFTS